MLISLHGRNRISQHSIDAGNHEFLSCLLQNPYIYSPRTGASSVRRRRPPYLESRFHTGGQSMRVDRLRVAAFTLTVLLVPCTTWSQDSASATITGVARDAS